eukprot:TRINITY_DN49173_c0_g1_i1.p1 TRINITY_DN49173_c0_g1~~TRINITY_DN49173_c0_g1_i1.p1  ORF type:complete len:255 (+),score=37.45 TRINITY_DN49173_c0_g1_i1:105-869(+)
MLRSLVGSEMCIRDRYQRRVRASFEVCPVAAAVGAPSGIGRLLMETALDRAREITRAAGHGPEACLVELTVDVYNMPALGLYLKLGFVARGTLAVMRFEGDQQDESTEIYVSETEVRAMTVQEIDGCADLARTMLGLDPTNALSEQFSNPGDAPAPTVVFDASTKEVLGYCSGLNMTGHLVASSDHAAQALVARGEAMSGQCGVVPMVCVPLEQQAKMSEWMVHRGWKLRKLLLSMSLGPYVDCPASAVYFPRY